MTLVMGGPELLVTRPLSATLLAITAALLVWPVIAELREKK